MPIVFAENFQQDVPLTVVRRYPGSTRALQTGAAEIPNAWPLTYASILQFGKIPFTEENDRFELRLEFVNNYTANRSTTPTPFEFFGIPILVPSATESSLLGHPFSVGMDAQSMNIVVERNNSRFVVFILVDDQVVLVPKSIDWTPTSWIGWGSNAGNPICLSGWPNFITSIVVAVDTPPGTRLGPTTWTKRELSVTGPGSWVFTDQGYVEDTDKADPLTGSPRIQTTGFSNIEFSIDDVVEADVTNLYLNKGSELPEIGVSVGGELYPVTEDLTVPRLMTVTSNQFGIQTVQLPPGAQTNGDIAFLGERADIISYADLSTSLSFTAGTVNTADGGNKWLEFLIDGKRLLVSKVSARYTVSWEHIYNAGLVYGLDGPGMAPAGTPVNQLRTIEIGGIVYKVRLLRGNDTDPTTTGTGTGAERAGSHNSEWARLFAPITSVLWTYYTGPKLASYTEADLGIGGTTVGRVSWCQEHLKTSVPRVWWGGSSVRDWSYNDFNVGTVAHGWRPVLEQV